MTLDKEFYTAIELGKLLGINPNSVHRMKARGDIAYFKIGRATRFRRKDIEAYLKRQRRVTPVEVANDL